MYCTLKKVVLICTIYKINARVKIHAFVYETYTITRIHIHNGVYKCTLLYTPLCI